MNTWEKEQKRVDEVTEHIASTLHHVNDELTSAIQTGRNLVKKNRDLTIKDGNEDALRESSFHVREQENQLAMMEHKVRRGYHQQQQMEKMAQNPYFGRLDLLDEDGEKESFYFGLGAFQYNGRDEVYDWRTPIATLFYEDHLGKSHYMAQGKEIEADILLKRQFVIKRRKIEAMEDTEQTIADDVLLTTLSQHSSAHMKQITATIQKEQNDIIRDLHHPYIMIQGIAGSGKTAVLLQRLAYLLYHQRQFIKSENVIMFSPNPIFSDYISNVLPSLGESDIYRVSYDYFQRHLLKGVQLLKPNKKWKTIHQFFNRYALVEALQTYMKRLSKKGLQYQNLYRQDGTRCFSKQDIAALYHQTTGATIAERVEMLQQLLLKALDEKKEAYKQSDDASMQVNVLGPDLIEQYQSEYNALPAKEKEAFLMNKVTELAFRSCTRMIQTKKFIRDDLQYLHFLKFLARYTEEALFDDYFMTMRQYLKENKAHKEDVAIFIYLSQMIKQNRTFTQYKEVMIDELQDYTPLQLLLIHSLFPNAHYTLCGDHHQLIFQNDTMIGHLDELFHHTVKTYTLTTSYRNTYEIVTFADAILGEEVSGTVARHGEWPEVWRHSIEDFCQSVNPHERTAIITKDKATFNQWAKQMPQSVYIIDKQRHLADEGVMLMPLSLAKGLEFDNVLMLDTEACTISERYTMATRAMHRLYIYEDTPLTWLASISDKYYRCD